MAQPTPDVALAVRGQAFDGWGLRRSGSDVPEEVHSESQPSGDLVRGPDDRGKLIYVLPAIPANVARVRHEIVESLTRHKLAGERHEGQEDRGQVQPVRRRPAGATPRALSAVASRR